MKVESKYSTAWYTVNIIANNIVNNKLYKAFSLLPFIKEWCEYVTAIPDVSSIKVFNKGNSKASIDSTPEGGQNIPTSAVGDKELWKKVQNIAIKNNASDTINKPTPKFRPFFTADVWFPKYVPSAVISLNHKPILYTKEIKPKNTKYFPL